MCPSLPVRDTQHPRPASLQPAALSPPGAFTRPPALPTEAFSATWTPLELGPYRVTLAQTLAEREAACRLRFKVFNLELREGLAASYMTGIDTDRFDPFCEHLMVYDRRSHAVVGTYRMQSGATAASHLGYYSEQEFDFRPYEPLRYQTLELGRASIDRDHRSSEVLTLLWRGIARYARLHGLRYLVGCSSLNSQDPATGWQVFRQLAGFLIQDELRTVATPAFTLPYTESAPESPARVPKLLRTYLGIGARICAKPAWDQEFGSIDFLTLLDLQAITPAARLRFLIGSR